MCLCFDGWFCWLVFLCLPVVHWESSAGYLRSSVTALGCRIVVSALSGKSSTGFYLLLWFARHSRIVVSSASLPSHSQSGVILANSPCYLTSPVLPGVHVVPTSMSSLKYLAQASSKCVASKLSNLFLVQSLVTHLLRFYRSLNCVFSFSPPDSLSSLFRQNCHVC